MDRNKIEDLCGSCAKVISCQTWLDILKRDNQKQFGIAKIYTITVVYSCDDYEDAEWRK